MNRSLPTICCALLIIASQAWAVGSITVKDGETDDAYAPPTPTRGATDQPIGRFSIKCVDFNGVLNTVNVKCNGPRTGLSNFKLWFSTDNAFGGDTQLGVAPDPGDGGTISFTALTQPMVITFTYWCFITADVASNATGIIRPQIVTPVFVSSTGYVIPAGNLTTADVPVPVALSHLTLE